MHNGAMPNLGSLVRTFFVVALVAAAAIIAVPTLMRLSMEQYMHRSVIEVPKREAALVLGASVVRGKPTPVLEQRAKTAVALYTAGSVQKILVTGDNGALTHDEVTPVRKYLLDAGVAPEDIFLDHAGFDTYSSMYRARDVFEVETMVVVTQDFHLPRALYLARHLGIDAHGLVAGSHGTPRDYLREIPASVKALLDLTIGREPRFLGDAFPISGDGQPTWY